MRANVHMGRVKIMASDTVINVVAGNNSLAIPQLNINAVSVMKMKYVHLVVALEKMPTLPRMTPLVAINAKLFVMR